MSRNLKPTAYLERAQIDRVVPFEERSIVGMDRMILDIELSKVVKKQSDYQLKNGDVVQIF